MLLPTFTAAFPDVTEFFSIIEIIIFTTESVRDDNEDHTTLSAIINLLIIFNKSFLYIQSKLNIV